MRILQSQIGAIADLFRKSIDRQCRKNSCVRPCSLSSAEFIFRLSNTIYSLSEAAGKDVIVVADTHAPAQYAGQDNGAHLAPGPPTTDQQRWDLWARFMEPLISAKFHVGAAGNHELEPVSPGCLLRCIGLSLDVPSAARLCFTKSTLSSNTDGSDCSSAQRS